MLDKFIVAHCDNDLSVLVIKGKPSQDILKAAWNKLYQQYIKSIGGIEYDSRLQEIKDYIVLEGKIRRAKSLLTLCKIPLALDMVSKRMNKFGYPISQITEKNLHIVVKQFNGHLKADMVRLEGLAKELQKDVKKKEKPKSDYYYSMIVAIADVLKIQLNPKETSVRLYCTYVNQYQKHVQELTKQHGK